MMPNRCALPLPTNIPVSGSSDTLLCSGTEAFSDEQCKAADDLLRRGMFGAALNLLTRTSPGSLALYSNYVRWANLAIQAFILSGRALLLLEEGRTEAMKALLERCTARISKDLLSSHAHLLSSHAQSSVNSSSFTDLHLPSQPLSSSHDSSSSSAQEAGTADSHSGPPTMVISSSNGHSLQPHPHAPQLAHLSEADSPPSSHAHHVPHASVSSATDSTLISQTATNPMGQVYDEIELAGVARMYVEDCLCGAFKRHWDAARWLDGAQGRAFMTNEQERVQLYNMVVQDMPDGAAFVAVQKANNARLQKLAARRAAIPTNVGPQQQSSGNGVLSGVPSAELAQASPQPTPPAIAAPSMLAPLNPIFQSLARPVACMSAWLTSAHNVCFKTAPSSCRTASAPGDTNTVPTQHAAPVSLSDDGGSSSNGGNQQNTKKPHVSRPQETASGSSNMPSGPDGTNPGNFLDLDVAAKVVVAAIAAGVVIYALKEEQANIMAAAKRVLNKARTLTSEFLGMALTYSPNPVAAAGLAARR